MVRKPITFKLNVAVGFARQALHPANSSGITVNGATQETATFHVQVEVAHPSNLLCSDGYSRRGAASLASLSLSGGYEIAFQWCLRESRYCFVAAPLLPVSQATGPIWRIVMAQE